uniref:Uncharacterized protein n=1 Tax=Arundo donax TaxID=35708 RepID=A0A0A8YIY5_ARUDO
MLGELFGLSQAVFLEEKGG